ncbi:sensor histidine kinase [Phyllobacterium leguminum]|uniref:histidine kinase n=1 Tax=Phyllobacterium leguminum TaxID=314237 RepID=A0A318T281_9HYPH|nr:CHASE3 domain-containing protein [Phyllobacterium leguminum]PYE88729.1 two-component sensor histidine kinase [Phyllobacterium leguminum]
MNETSRQVPEPRTRAAYRRQLAVIISLCLVLLTATSTVILTRGINYQLADVSKTYQLIQQASKTLLLVTNMETSQRGYLLTLERSYLDLYYAASLSIDESMSRLASMARGNPPQEERVREIEALTTQIQGGVRQTVQLAVEGQLGKALEDIRSDKGKMDQLRETIRNFMDEEDRRLIQRNDKIDRTRDWLTIASLAALTSAVMLAYSLLSRVQRYVRLLSEGQSALLSENVLLEERVQERTAELENARAVAERERRRVEVLLQDSNHRIGNSLATVSSLLSLQLREATNENARRVLIAARDRVQTISTAHRRLRLGDDLETVRADEFLQAVVEDITTALVPGGRIKFETAFAPLNLNARDVTTIGIILGELVTNAVKHAFPDNREGIVSISFGRGEDGVLELAVADDGVGQGKGKGKRGKRQGLGMLVIEQLCLQFGDAPHYSNNGDAGTRAVIRFPSLEVRG